MTKGEQTRLTILNASLKLAARLGLDGLTIGRLAEETRMSKSGVFAHFGSREELQLATLRAYEQQFVQEVLAPALKPPIGMPRLCMIFDCWADWMVRESERGCIYVAGATEFDDRPGPIRDLLVQALSAWEQELLFAIGLAKEAGDLERQVDENQLLP